MIRFVTHPSIRHSFPSTSYEKGSQFEEYIIELFNKRHFKLEKWRRSEKIVDQVMQSDHCYPDLELIFLGRREYKFAIECKWRKEMHNGKIEWAEEYLIKKYIEFQKDLQIPVFVAIGIGGSPRNPDELFVTPLHHIAGNSIVKRSDLLPFRRTTTARFFIDMRQGRLF